MFWYDKDREPKSNKSWTKSRVIDINIILTYVGCGLTLFFYNKIQESHLGICLYISMVLSEILVTS